MGFNQRFPNRPSALSGLKFQVSGVSLQPLERALVSSAAKAEGRYLKPEGTAGMTFCPVAVMNNATNLEIQRMPEPFQVSGFQFHPSPF
jgi:hypothetical protein